VAEISKGRDVLSEPSLSHTPYTLRQVLGLWHQLEPRRARAQTSAWAERKLAAKEPMRSLDPKPLFSPLT
jgi:hypothetical protein